ncbi:cation diffusion facilitator family transporter [Occultella glacieicola]|uniref:Cation diffusion facilitator family transporter n=1 Tax=Occultella glacieicola TaxID=2518684 RepID=A0ABY2E5U1_9MICO|nr:cation diffusion facilitator family transporter [Occultella glacieicola]TDE94866.1 cation diffusion facilitator family transporter [Occultella glacieicola]
MSERRQRVSLTVLIAFGANLLIAVAKSAAGAITGSASMVAEAAHSWADTGNEIFLMIAERRARRPQDPAHPLGYGREAYVWSLFAALGLFVAGSAVSIMHGIQSLTDPEPATNFAVAYVVFAIALVLEGTSFRQAYRQVRRGAKESGRDLLEHAIATSDPTLRAVFAEDFAAVLGILIASGGVLAHQLTGSPVPDAIGSILVGLLLGVVAIILVDRNRRFLVGVEVSAAVRARVVEALLAVPEVSRVTQLHIEFVGPRQVYLVATLDLVGDEVESHVGARLRALEERIETTPSVIRAVLTVAAPDAPDLDLGLGARAGDGGHAGD